MIANKSFLILIYLPLLSIMQVLTPGLVLYHKYDQAIEQGASFIQDFSGNSNLGYISGSSWMKPGKFKGCYTFNGINSHIYAKNVPALSIPQTGQLSISFWVRFDNLKFNGELDGNGLPK